MPRSRALTECGLLGEEPLLPLITLWLERLAARELTIAIQAGEALCVTVCALGDAPPWRSSYQVRGLETGRDFGPALVLPLLAIPAEQQDGLAQALELVLNEGQPGLGLALSYLQGTLG